MVKFTAQEIKTLKLVGGLIILIILIGLVVGISPSNQATLKCENIILKIGHNNQIGGGLIPCENNKCPIRYSAIVINPTDEDAKNVRLVFITEEEGKQIISLKDIKAHTTQTIVEDLYLTISQTTGGFEFDNGTAPSCSVLWTPPTDEKEDSKTTNMTPDVVTCRIDSAKSETNTITVTQRNNATGGKVESVYVDGARRACTGPELTPNTPINITPTNCSGLTFGKGRNLLVTGSKSMSCSGTAT